MRTREVLSLALRNLRRDRRAVFSGAFGVSVGVIALLFFIALGLGISDLVRSKILPVNLAQVEVIAPKVAFGGVFGTSRLDDALVQRLKGISGVSEAYPKMSVRVSAVSRYQGDFFGRPLRMGVELMAVGADPRLIEKELEESQRFEDPKGGEPIPVVLSPRLLELYNKSFAVQRKLPSLSPELLAGFEFPVEFGRSFVAAVDGNRVQQGRFSVAGFSEYALLGGVTIPLNTARRLNREHGEDAESYSSVVLQATGPDAVVGIVEEVRRMGLEVDDDEQQLSQQVGFAIQVVTGTLALLSLLIALVSAFNIAHAFRAATRERRREIGVLRAVGASRLDIIRLFMVEALFVGGAGGMVGSIGAFAAAQLADIAASRYLPDFPFKPESFFVFPGLLLVSGFFLGVLAALFGALGPVLKAARQEPVEALAE